MTLRRARRRRIEGVPAGISLGTLLPLGLLVGSVAWDEDEDTAPAATRQAA